MRGRQAVALTPKAFAVLEYLVRRHGQLVTKEELLRAVWSDSFVTDASLKVCVREIRKVLQDDADQPRFIETAHRRGYRFIARVRDVDVPESAPADAGTPVPAEPAAPGPLREDTPALVEREAELRELRSRLEHALRGQRQMVF